MAEETLVKETLSDEMKRDGAALTRALDEAGWPVVASFWYYEADYNRWQLTLVSPRVRTDGSRKAYGAVIKALDAIHQSRTNLNFVRAIAPDHPLVTRLASVIQTGWTIGGIPFYRQAIDGEIVEDAYLYRMTSESAAA
jgi:hypothetical protein